ncbi:kinase-like domain-containing protein [Rhizophagus irregularis DAOM 181602=DAOM 197198]|nr:kinase-like domain-containing protein [Rhizophagus irregularis DAOM 181602=DAOM 197198]
MNDTKPLLKSLYVVTLKSVQYNNDHKILERESLEHNLLNKIHYKKESSENIKLDNYYEKDIANKEFGVCFNCNKPQTEENWCLNCNSKFFQKEFNNWRSENMHIDKFIQEAQLNARNNNEVIEWINYDHFINIQYITRGGFSIIYGADWLDGSIDCWNYEKENWNRITQKNGIRVILKSLNDSSNIHEDFLNEREMPMGNLRSILMIKKWNQNDKYYNIYEIASSLSALHKCDLVHGDLHSGNILFKDIFTAYISDFGLSKPADQSIDYNVISGVLPYIAPEVLRGKPYTKAADIYSLGVIMWEFTSGVPAFNNRQDDFNLSLDICRGLRPEIIEGTEPDYEELMKRCWNTDPNKRPTADELAEIFDVLSTKFIMLMKDEERKSVPAVPAIPENKSYHPLTCYTSRKFDYSVKLNEILNQEELSFKFTINEKDDYKETILSESLDGKIKEKYGDLSRVYSININYSHLDEVNYIITWNNIMIEKRLRHFIRQYTDIRNFEQFLNLNRNAKYRKSQVDWQVTFTYLKEKETALETSLWTSKRRHWKCPRCEKKKETFNHVWRCKSQKKKMMSIIKNAYEFFFNEILKLNYVIIKEELFQLFREETYGLLREDVNNLTFIDIIKGIFPLDITRFLINNKVKADDRIALSVLFLDYVYDETFKIWEDRCEVQIKKEKAFQISEAKKKSMKSYDSKYKNRLDELTTPLYGRAEGLLAGIYFNKKPLDFTIFIFSLVLLFR